MLWEIDDEIYKNFRENRDIIREYTDILSVSTKNLKRETESFFGLRTEVIPNFVDINYFYYLLFSGKKRRKISIGIIGTPSHREDFNFIAPIIKRISEKYSGKISIKFWGYLPEVLKNTKGVYEIPFEKNYIKYSERLRKEKFDFCIVPLLENRFNNVKSNIKWLEFSMNKIPAVFSDVPAYESVENFETGIKVKNNEREWIDAISLMIEDNLTRERIRENSYKEVLTKYTLQNNFGKILQLF